MKPSPDIARLVEIMAALRTPGTGCPWDLEQEGLRSRGRDPARRLGRSARRTRRQVVFHARMAQEAGLFGFGDVVQAITEKLVRRHPHVFGDARGLSAEAVKGLWDQIKSQEKTERAARRGTDDAATGALAGVPATLPALTRALKLQQKAGKVGFDWNLMRITCARKKRRSSRRVRPGAANRRAK
jgi:ATP diphosphatase